MIKTTYSNGFSYKYYPFLSEVFYSFLLSGFPEHDKFLLEIEGLKNEN